MNLTLNQSRRLLTVGVFAIVEWLAIQTALAGPVTGGPIVSVAPAHDVVFLGETLKIRVRVEAPADKEMSMIRLERIYRFPGALAVIVTSPNGDRLPGGPPAIRPPTGIQPDDLVALRPGQVFDGSITSFYQPRMTGKHAISVAYRPNWKVGPTIKATFEVNVIEVGTGDIVVRKDINSASDPGTSVSVLIVREKPGSYWLLHQNGRTQTTMRWGRVSKEAEFTATAVPGGAGKTKGQLLLKLTGQKQTRTGRFDFESGVEIEHSP